VWATASVPAGNVRAMRGRLPITLTVDGEPVESVTHVVRSGPYVRVLQTVTQPGLAVELHSTLMIETVRALTPGGVAPTPKCPAVDGL
jgi:hypothetical protein